MANVTINQLPAASTIDPTQDFLPIYTASATATQRINRNTYLGLTSAPIGLTDSQTLTNKVLTSPTISSPTLSGTLSGTYTIGGTPTFPSSVVTLTDIQTLTNKTLTSPTLNTPTITNATISADTLSGFTTSTNGTVYGISVTAGKLSGTAISNNTLPYTALDNGSSWIWQAWTPTFTGFSSAPTGVSARYKQVGKTVYATWVFPNSATSNATTFTISLPVAVSSSAIQFISCIQVRDSGTTQSTPGIIVVDPATSTTVATIFKNTAAAAFTASGDKRASGSFFYEAA